MKTGELVINYEEKDERFFHLDDYYVPVSKEPEHLFVTETGAAVEKVMPLTSVHDIIFSELPESVKTNKVLQPFLFNLFLVYSRIKKEDYTYLPLLVNEIDGDNIVIDWVYETVRISFFFSNERNSYSLTRFDPNRNSYFQKIETLSKDRYKEIATEVIQAIA